MVRPPVEVVLIDDNQDYLGSIYHLLRTRTKTDRSRVHFPVRFRTHLVSGGEVDLVSQIPSAQFYFVDQRLPGVRGDQLLDKLKEREPNAKFVSITSGTGAQIYSAYEMVERVTRVVLDKNREDHAKRIEDLVVEGASGNVTIGIYGYGPHSFAATFADECLAGGNTVKVLSRVFTGDDSGAKLARQVFEAKAPGRAIVVEDDSEFIGADLVLYASSALAHGDPNRIARKHDRSDLLRFEFEAFVRRAKSLAKKGFSGGLMVATNPIDYLLKSAEMFGFSHDQSTFAGYIDSHRIGSEVSIRRLDPKYADLIYFFREFGPQIPTWVMGTHGKNYVHVPHYALENLNDVQRGKLKELLRGAVRESWHHGRREVLSNLDERTPPTEAPRHSAQLVKDIVDYKPGPKSTLYTQQVLPKKGITGYTLTPAVYSYTEKGIRFLPDRVAGRNMGVFDQHDMLVHTRAIERADRSFIDFLHKNKEWINPLLP